LQINSFLNS